MQFVAEEKDYEGDRAGLESERENHRIPSGCCASQAQPCNDSWSDLLSWAEQTRQKLIPFCSFDRL